MEEKQRTAQQNRALHKYFELMADALNEAGLDMRVVLKPEVDIPWNKITVKEYLWRPMQKAQLDKKSTTELTTLEINEVFETMNRHLSSKFGKWSVHIPFPSYENFLIDFEKYDSENKR
jgi:hypothetical protein